MRFICCLNFPTKKMLQEMCRRECLVCAQQRVASEVIQVGMWHLMGDVLLHRRRMCRKGKWKAASDACCWEENQSDGWEKWAWQNSYDLVQTRKCWFLKPDSSVFLWLLQIGIWMEGKEGYYVPLGLLSGKKNTKCSCNPGVNRVSNLRDKTHVTHLDDGGVHMVIDEQKWRICTRWEMRNSCLSTFSLSWQLDMRVLRGT